AAGRTGPAVPGLFLEPRGRHPGRRGEGHLRLPSQDQRRAPSAPQSDRLDPGGLPMRVRRRVSERLSDERGATVVIVALVMVAILGMLALVTDVGALVTTRRRVVTASDSGALAAAQSFARSEGGNCGSVGGNAKAQSEATSYALDNISTASSVAFTPNCGHKSVEVQFKAPVHFVFAQILGAGTRSE